MIGKDKKSGFVLMADDDDDFHRLTEIAIKEVGIKIQLRRVEDGEDLMDYLFRRNKYKNANNCPRPELILLDLNMPRKNGFEALREIRSNPDLRPIPVIMLTVSSNLDDVQKSYNLGANSFITKPLDFQEWVEILKLLREYWFEKVKLPDAGNLKTANPTS